MRSLIVITSVFLLAAGTAFGAFSAGDSGTSASQFLKLGAGARATAMGDAFTAVANDATGVYWNPAGLNRVRGTVASAMHAVWFEDITYNWVSLAREEGKGHAWGAGIQYLSYGSLTERDDAGFERGSFTPSDLAVSVSYAGAVKEIMLGGSVKYVSSKIQKTSGAIAADIGLMVSLLKDPPRPRAGGRSSKRTGLKYAGHMRETYRSGSGAESETANASPRDKLTIGVVAQNLGSEMKSESSSAALPFCLKFGAAYLLRPGWVTALDVIAPIDNEIAYGLGTEYGLTINKRMGVMVRLGYNTRARQTGGQNGISAGLGFNFLTYSVDYAFAPYGDLGDTHRISFSVKL